MTLRFGSIVSFTSSFIMSWSFCSILSLTSSLIIINKLIIMSLRFCFILCANDLQTPVKEGLQQRNIWGHANSLLKLNRILTLNQFQRIVNKLATIVAEEVGGSALSSIRSRAVPPLLWMYIMIPSLADLPASIRGLSPYDGEHLRLKKTNPTLIPL
ncbi:unnamed protein product [Nesidiocoris tenuis]|uniref:Uncharacterized protein n=1 Tax=Nesidiocoris tenuis TaxID=355587 RepID=A0A6H5HH43_9HEMI|nr:unnamed protein product [Nesidiocoris tenuis]